MVVSLILLSLDRHSRCLGWPHCLFPLYHWQSLAVYSTLWLQSLQSHEWQWTQNPSPFHLLGLWPTHGLLQDIGQIQNPQCCHFIGLHCPHGKASVSMSHCFIVSSHVLQVGYMLWFWQQSSTWWTIALCDLEIALQNPNAKQGPLRGPEMHHFVPMVGAGY